jgi:glycosylphosphatidylinositol deacylase
VGSTHTPAHTTRTAALSMLLIFALVLLVVPWQVAFLGCWAVHLYTCATSPPPAPNQPAIPLDPLDARPPPGSALLQSEPEDEDESGSELTGGPHAPPSRSRRSSSTRGARAANNAHANAHLLLLLTWLLPLAAPVLAVWVRTLLTAGWTTPFDGDHNVLYVAPFLVLVDYAGWARRPVLERHP